MSVGPRLALSLGCFGVLLCLGGLLGCPDNPPAADGGPADAGPAALLVDERTVASADGVQIFARAVGGGAADAKSALAINGGPGLSHHYLAALEALASSSLRIIFYDQRGTGGSQTSANYGVSRQLADIEAVLDAYQAGPVAVVGHSWGSFLAQRLVMERPERVARLVLVSGMAATWADQMVGAEALQARIAELQAQGLIPAELPGDSCAQLEVILPAYHHDPHFALGAAWQATTCDGFVSSQTNYQASMEGYDHRAALGALQIPSTVIAGDSDFLGGAVAAALAAAFDPAHVRLHAIPACGHFPWDECPDPALDLTAAALQGSW